MAPIAVIVVVMIVFLAKVCPATITNTSQLTPAIVVGAALGSPTVAGPVTGIEIPAITTVVVVHVSVAIVVVALQDGAT
jgi:hypothetical protein